MHPFGAQRFETVDDRVDRLLVGKDPDLAVVRAHLRPKVVFDDDRLLPRLDVKVGRKMLRVVSSKIIIESQ